jgi:antitoxin ParD1/3/4
VASTITLSVSDDMKAYVEQRLATGEFADVEDYVRELIRADEAHLEWLRAEIQKGFDSGISPLSIDEIFDQALEKARRRCA